MRKKNELESQQVALENDLEKLQLQAKSAGQFIKIFNREVFGVQRKLTKVRMRLRSMKIKKEKKCPEMLSTSLPVFNSSLRHKHNLNLNLSLEFFTDSQTTTKAISERTPEAIPEIDEIDEEFDPTESNHPHERPYGRLLPDIALPHSKLQEQWIWTRSVPRCIHPLDSQALLEGKGAGGRIRRKDHNMFLYPEPSVS